MKPIKLLLVDDEKDFVTTLSDRIREYKFESDTALSGEQAIELVAGQVPDVMVLDHFSQKQGQRPSGMVFSQLKDRIGERLGHIVLTFVGSRLIGQGRKTAMVITIKPFSNGLGAHGDMPTVDGMDITVFR